MGDQLNLARYSPLRTIPVKFGLEHFRRHIGYFRGLTKEAFIHIAQNLMQVWRVPRKPDDIECLEAIFDSMDYSLNGKLSLGDWASGLTVFFKGCQEEKVSALFSLLDRNEDGSLSKPDIKEYIMPLVQAMTPPEASALR